MGLQRLLQDRFRQAFIEGRVVCLPGPEKSPIKCQRRVKYQSVWKKSGIAFAAKVSPQGILETFSGLVTQFGVMKEVSAGIAFCLSQP
jgi:hypothetical protein